MSNTPTSKTPVFIARNQRTTVYHLQRMYGGKVHPACNQRLWCYATDVKEAKRQGLHLCKSCEKLLAPSDLVKIVL